MNSLLLLAAAAAASPASAEPYAAADRQVSIPFVSQPRSIRTFEARDEDVVYLQDRRSRWYRADLGGPCLGLRWASRIGYDTHGSLSLGRGDSILVEGQRCMIVSLTRSEPPPRRTRKKRRG